MSASEELWTAENEQIAEQLASGKIDREIFVRTMRYRGFDQHEADSMAAVALGEDP